MYSYSFDSFLLKSKFSLKLHNFLLSYPAKIDFQRDYGPMQEQLLHHVWRLNFEFEMGRGNEKTQLQGPLIT